MIVHWIERGMCDPGKVKNPIPTSLGVVSRSPGGNGYVSFSEYAG